MNLIGTVCNEISFKCIFLNSFDKLLCIFVHLSFNFDLKATYFSSTGRLNVEKIKSGTVLLLRSIQKVHLAKEYGVLSQGKP